MGALYEAKQRIEKVIDEQKRERALTMGQIGLKSGFMLAFVNPTTPDDPEKLAKLRSVAKEILGTTV